MQQASNFITSDNKKELEKELVNLKTIVRPEILKRLSYAKSLGDLSENAEYHSAREEQGKNESRIKQIEHILKTAEIVKRKDTGAVAIGSSVTVKKKGGKDTKVFTIVGEEEADMALGKLSYKSPLGSALMDQEKGSDVTMTTPKGEIVYSIVEVN